MIPILYERGETAFTSNGLGRLPDCGMCQVTEERNGIFEVQFTYPVTGHNYENIREGRIILCTHDESGVAQPFDIYARTQPIDGVVTFYAHHISYRLSRIILRPFTANNCAEALSTMETQTYNPNPFTFWTDKASSGSFSVTVPQPLRETLGGQAGSILDAFGKGDYEWDHYTVKLWQSRGQETGVTIRYGVNMTDYNRDINYWESYSGAVPYWVDAESGEMVTPGAVYAEGYDASNAEVIAMDLSEEWDTRPTEAQVSARALKRMRDNRSWLPTDNIHVSFAQLWQTEEYADVAPLQRLRLCDRVNVVYGPGGVAVNNVQIIRVVWDALLDRYDSMELGTARASLDQMIRQEVTEGVLKIVPTKSFLQAALDYATDLIKGGLGGHLVINTDADGHPNELLIMDTDDISTAVNVWRWNLNGLGHSHNGYNGPFDDVAITMDGKINASMIVTGFMSAARLRGGVIDGTTVLAKLLNIIDDDNNVIASFDDTIVLGNADSLHSEIDYNSFEMYDANGDVFMSMGDLRDSDGKATLTQNYTGNGIVNDYYLRVPVDSASDVTVYVNGSETSNWVLRGQTAIRFNQTPADGDSITIIYITRQPLYHYDFGVRKTNDINEIGQRSFVEGNNNIAKGLNSHAEGSSNNAEGTNSHAEGYNTEASGYGSHAEGDSTKASGDKSHSEGNYTVASGYGSHAEGNQTVASAYYCHAEGQGNTASYECAHAEGRDVTASGYASHAEGCDTAASGYASHAEGWVTVASNYGSHAEGYNTEASGYASHAEGNGAKASGNASHAEGVGTIATKECQHVVGRWNVADSTAGSNLTYIEIVGNGSANSRFNIRTLDYNGNEYISGTLTQSSDERLKDECGEVPDVSGVKARMFRWNEKKLRHDDKVHLGYFAQEVEKVAPYLVTEDDMGYKSLDYIGFLVAKMASLEARVAELEKEG